MNRLLRLSLLLCTLSLTLACTRTDRATLILPTVTATESTPLPAPLLQTKLPTQKPSKTRKPPSATATITLTPSATPTRTPRRSPTPTFTPSNTATLDPSNVLLRFVSPGPMSKLVSPINLVVFVSAEYTGLTRIELIGEDGRELYRKVFRTYNQRTASRVSEQIQFEIPTAAEVARLQVSTYDDYGRMMTYNSVRVLLLAVGENFFTPAYEPLERVVLRSPRRNAEINDGEVRIVGQIRPVNNGPVILELIDRAGTVLNSRVLYFDASIAEYQDFETSLPYQITEKQVYARIILRQSDDRISGLAYLYSHEILLKP